MEGIPDLDRELARELWEVVEGLKRRQELLDSDSLHNHIHGLIQEAMEKLEMARDMLISKE